MPTTVSYVTTLYNKVAFLPHLLASLRAQEGSFDKHFVFVDDGSTDGTVDQLKAMTAGWPGMTIIEQENAGPSIALNRGFAAAQADFVKPMDGDDVIAPWATQRLLDAMKETGCPIAYDPESSKLRYEVTDPPETVLQSFRQNCTQVSRIENMLWLSLKRSQTNPTAWMARRELVVAAGGCDPNVFIQDYSLELRMAARAPFASVNEELVRQPATANGRLSSNEAQLLHDGNLSVINLLKECSDLPSGMRNYALRRVATRMWLWAKRRNGKTPFSREFLLYLRARLGDLQLTDAEADLLCAPFRASGHVRLVHGATRLAALCPLIIENNTVVPLS